MSWAEVLKNRRNTFHRKGRKTKVRSEPREEIIFSPEQQMYGIEFLLDRNWGKLQQVKDAIDAIHDVDSLPKRVRRSNSYWFDLVTSSDLHLVNRDVNYDVMSNYAQRKSDEKREREGERLMSEALKNLDGIHIYSQKEYAALWDE